MAALNELHGDSFVHRLPSLPVSLTKNSISVCSNCASVTGFFEGSFAFASLLMDSLDVINEEKLSSCRLVTNDDCSVITYSVFPYCSPSVAVLFIS